MKLTMKYSIYIKFLSLIIFSVSNLLAQTPFSMGQSYQKSIEKRQFIETEYGFNVMDVPTQEENAYFNQRLVKYDDRLTIKHKLPDFLLLSTRKEMIDFLSEEIKWENFDFQESYVRVNYLESRIDVSNSYKRVPLVRHDRVGEISSEGEQILNEHKYLYSQMKDYFNPWVVARHIEMKLVSNCPANGHKITFIINPLQQRSKNGFRIRNHSSYDNRYYFYNLDGVPKKLKYNASGPSLYFTQDRLYVEMSDGDKVISTKRIKNSEDFNNILDNLISNKIKSKNYNVFEMNEEIEDLAMAFNRALIPYMELPGDNNRAVSKTKEKKTQSSGFKWPSFMTSSSENIEPKIESEANEPKTQSKVLKPNFKRIDSMCDPDFHEALEKLFEIKPDNSAKPKKKDPRA